MVEVPKKKITLDGLKNAFKLYSYIKPFRIEYSWGIFFLLGSSLASPGFPTLLGELVDSGNRGNLSRDLNHIALLQETLTSSRPEEEVLSIYSEHLITIKNCRFT